MATPVMRPSESILIVSKPLPLIFPVPATLLVRNMFFQIGPHTDLDRSNPFLPVPGFGNSRPAFLLCESRAGNLYRNDEAKEKNDDAQHDATLKLGLRSDGARSDIRQRKIGRRTASLSTRPAQDRGSIDPAAAA